MAEINIGGQIVATFGEYRALKSEERWSAAWVVAHAIEHEDERASAILDWWRVADMAKVSREVVWCLDGVESEASKNPLWWVDERLWYLTLAGQHMTSSQELDLSSIQAAWSLKPARYVASIWEEWASMSSRDLRHLSPTTALNIVEAFWQDGDAAHRETLKLLRHNIEQAPEIARNEMAYDATHAIFATRSVLRATEVVGLNGYTGHFKTVSRSAALDASAAAAHHVANLWAPGDDGEYARLLGEQEVLNYTNWGIAWTQHVLEIVQARKLKRLCPHMSQFKNPPRMMGKVFGGEDVEIKSDSFAYWCDRWRGGTAPMYTGGDDDRG